MITTLGKPARHRRAGEKQLSHRLTRPQWTKQDAGLFLLHLPRRNSGDRGQPNDAITKTRGTQYDTELIILRTTRCASSRTEASERKLARTIDRDCTTQDPRSRSTLMFKTRELIGKPIVGAPGMYGARVHRQTEGATC
jgi:hypothetical protein